jgi:hypothetical protein
MHTYLHQVGKGLPVAIGNALGHLHRRYPSSQAAAWVSIQEPYPFTRERAIFVAEHGHVRSWVHRIGEKVPFNPYPTASVRHPSAHTGLLNAPGLAKSCAIMLKIVSLVPKLTPMSPGALSPRPATLHHISMRQVCIGCLHARLTCWDCRRTRR